ncbi:MAG: ATP-dependent helicase [Syntrophobacterales bacterium]|nr:ATP-dependent helicase [Syntrophobacterales bacterium]
MWQSIKEILSPLQEQIVCWPRGPILVSAGAGSGKTRTLTAKIAYLVSEEGYSPDRILAITFTNKAAEEMKSRLESMTGLSRYRFPWIRTFHSACFKILNREAFRLGYRQPISIYSESQQRTLLKRILLSLNLDTTKYLGLAHSAISLAKNSGSPERFLDKYSHVPKIMDAYERYNEALKSLNAVDFEDILLLVRNLLRSEEAIRGFYQSAFDYILVDEFQDSNRLQNEITELLMRNGNLMVVGDDYQSIYGFRGSDLAYFVSFPERFREGVIFRLEENFRSTKPIVAAADALIANNTFRLEKRCYSNRPGPPIVLVECLNEREEARWVALRCIEHNLKNNIPFQSMAVLYRTRFCSLPFEEVFREMKIPYRIVGARGFFESKEIQDINAYLVSSLNPRDDMAFERVLNVPKRGIGSATLKKIEGFKQPGMSLQEATWIALQANILSKKVSKGLLDLKVLLSDIAKMSPKEAIECFISRTSYLNYLRDYSESEEDFLNRQGNIEQFIYMASESESLADLLERASLLQEDRNLDGDGEDLRAVQLMTFHGAKGLEFDVVFIIGVEDGLIPHWRAIADEWYGRKYIEAVEEERRLMYVAMTRAARYLHISWALQRQGKITEPSRFLDEIPKKYVIFEKSYKNLAKRRT